MNEKIQEDLNAKKQISLFLKISLDFSKKLFLIIKKYFHDLEFNKFYI